MGLLLALIVILSSVSSYYVFEIKKDTSNILKANYNTLEYTRAMLSSLDQMDGTDEKAVDSFASNLQKQIQNITEHGEREVTDKLTDHFESLKMNPSDANLKFQLRDDLFKIMELNVKAIKVKNDQAKQTAESANLLIAITGTLCFLIAFNLLMNLPHHVANPISQLTQSIKEIANGNYRQRVEFRDQSEFGDLARSFNTMAEKLREYNDSNLNNLLVEKKRLETLLGNMHDPVIGMDGDGKIFSVNHEAEAILSIKREDLIGKDASEIAGRNDLLGKLLAGESDQNPMKIYAHGKESYFQPEHFSIRIVPTGETNYVDQGRFIILRDITTFKELDYAKTNFIATVSHELKTPIASIKLSLNLLEKGISGEESHQLVESIREDSDRLLKITGELLEMSQLETGNIQLSMGKCAASEIVAVSLSAVKAQADQKQIKVVSMPGSENLKIKADKDKTSWVLINFLTNAIRFSPEGESVEITVKPEEHRIIFAVADKGKGIDVRYQTRIFDRYFQVPDSNKSGTGLGLAISREFIEAQSGGIGVESAPGMGSRFWFALPMA